MGHCANSGDSKGNKPESLACTWLRHELSDWRWMQWATGTWQRAPRMSVMRRVRASSWKRRAFHQTGPRGGYQDPPWYKAQCTEKQRGLRGRVCGVKLRGQDARFPGKNTGGSCFSFSRRSYWPRIKTGSPALQVDSLLTEPPGKPRPYLAIKEMSKDLLSYFKSAIHVSELFCF